MKIYYYIYKDAAKDYVLTTAKPPGDYLENGAFPNDAGILHLQALFASLKGQTTFGVDETTASPNLCREIKHNIAAFRKPKTVLMHRFVAEEPGEQDGQWHKADGLCPGNPGMPITGTITVKRSATFVGSKGYDMFREVPA